tara:strand:+ start:233 stop:604 length:372 start_codon:yes stop_codon:yes gene_type:complete
MKKIIILIVIILNSVLVLSQTNTNYLIENYTTSKGQTVKTKNYTQQYNFYIEKSERQRNIATIVGLVGGLVGVVGYNYLPRNTQGNYYLIITSMATSCISTTFYIRSSVNRRKAYKLKKNTYL